jgi:hypothetical protein
MKHEKLKINVFFSIKLMILLVHLPKLEGYLMQWIMVKNQKQEDQ